MSTPEPERNPKEPKPKETYMFLGYGNYGGGPLSPVNPGIIRNPNILEKFLQFLGLTEKPPRDQENTHQ